MSKLNFPLPEVCYSINPGMSYEELNRKLTSDEFVVGKVTFWNSEKKYFEVDLGNNLIGFLPIDEASIYPTQFPNGNLRSEAYYLIGKTICAKIILLSPDNIILSRKANMKEAFYTISNSIDQTILCYIKFAQDTKIFTDVGHGISGLLHVTNLTTSIINDVRDIGIKEKTVLQVTIKDISPEKFHVSLGYKELFENLTDKFNPNDMIEVISLNRVQNTDDGYFCYINPNTTAILNVPPQLYIPYGTKVIARVRSSRYNKLKLSFLTFA